MTTMRFVTATLLSAALFHFGTGLHPIPWLTWLAPLPVLVLAARSGPGAAFAAGALAWVAGQAQLWPYFTGTLEMPPILTGAMLAGSAIAFGLAVLLFGALLRRGRPVLAALAVPAVWVLTEYALAVSGPHGAWWSLAYTQADLLPVLQTASLAGPWGITFLLLGVPAATVACGTARRPRAAAGAVAVVALLLGYGFWRLATPVPPGQEKVALVAIDRNSTDTVDARSQEGRALIRLYGEAVKATVKAADARAVVLPEKVFEATTDTDVPLAHPGADVVAGMHVGDRRRMVNSAVDYPAGGGDPVRYDKLNLVPGVESDFLTPGDGSLAFAPGTTWGLIVCKDLDHPSLARAYRAAGASALLAPALDWAVDGWLHSRMAITRGVESGLSVARSARLGRLVISDPYGRVLAEAGSSAGDPATVSAALPERGVSTVYATAGDWLPWASAALVLVALAGLIRGGVSSRRGRRAWRPSALRP